MAAVTARTTRSMARAGRMAGEREVADHREPAAAAAAAAKGKESSHAPLRQSVLQTPGADKKRRRSLAYSSSGLAPTRLQSQKLRFGSDAEASETHDEDLEVIAEHATDVSGERSPTSAVHVPAERQVSPEANAGFGKIDAAAEQLPDFSEEPSWADRPMMDLIQSARVKSPRDAANLHTAILTPNGLLKPSPTRNGSRQERPTSEHNTQADAVEDNQLQDRLATAETEIVTGSVGRAAYIVSVARTGAQTDLTATIINPTDSLGAPLRLSRETADSPAQLADKLSHETQQIDHPAGSEKLTMQVDAGEGGISQVDRANESDHRNENALHDVEMADRDLQGADAENVGEGDEAEVDDMVDDENTGGGDESAFNGVRTDAGELAAEEDQKQDKGEVHVEDNRIPDNDCHQACEGAGNVAEGEGKKEDEEVAPSPQVQKEIRLFNEQFPWLQNNYRLLDKIGEGTFSTVYKAIDLRHHEYDNSRWEKCLAGLGTQDKVRHFVAIKRVYVTSSPERIANEISILRDLTGHESIAPLVTAFRHEDQVIIVLPYFPHQDFRDYFVTFDADDTRAFMRCLLGALAHAHSHRIIHRDVKPSNFLYDPRLRKGLLVDFGLAEREDPEPVTGTRLSEQKHGKSRLCCSVSNPGIWKGDARPSIRASRAGTRGFRAPEVLFKVVRQTVAIDVWAAGVIFLCIITRRFPFFSSPDDVEALGELTVIFGNVEMAKVAEKLNRTFHTNIPTMRFERSKLEKYARWFHLKDGDVLPGSAFDLLNKLMTLAPAERITAAEALRHPFLAE